MVSNITSKNFKKEVTESKENVLVDFWASWCGPCRMMLPIIEEIEKENGDCKVCKVNIDEEPELAWKYQIMAIPTMLVMREGKVVDRIIGVQKKEDILKAVQK